MPKQALDLPYRQRLLLAVIGERARLLRDDHAEEGHRVDPNRRVVGAVGVVAQVDLLARLRANARTRRVQPLHRAHAIERPRPLDEIGAHLHDDERVVAAEQHVATC